MIFKKKGIRIFLCLFCLSSKIFAQDADTLMLPTLEQLYGAETAQILRTQGKILHVTDKKKGDSLQYFPKTELVNNALNRWNEMKEDPPVFEIEALYLIPKPESDKGVLSLTKTAKIMTSLSRMKGIKYYSSTWNKYDVLYEESYLIDSYETKNMIKDPVLEKLDGIELYVLQKDNSFGEYTMKMDYSQDGNEIAFYMINMDPLKFLFLKALEKENMHVFLHTRDIGTDILVYLFIRAEYFETGLFKGFVQKSLNARIDAICNWFIYLYNEGGQ